MPSIDYRFFQSHIAILSKGSNTLFLHTSIVSESFIMKQNYAEFIEIIKLENKTNGIMTDYQSRERIRDFVEQTQEMITALTDTATFLNKTIDRLLKRVGSVRFEKERRNLHKQNRLNMVLYKDFKDNDEVKLLTLIRESESKMNLYVLIEHFESTYRELFVKLIQMQKGNAVVDHCLLDLQAIVRKHTTVLDCTPEFFWTEVVTGVKQIDLRKATVEELLAELRKQGVRVTVDSIT